MHKFFKWIKQHLKIKKFWGTSENAVRIQIYSAIIAYCMMAIVQKKMNIERSIYEMLQIVSISLTDTTNLKDLFAKPNCNIGNELDGSTDSHHSTVPTNTAGPVRNTSTAENSGLSPGRRIRDGVKVTLRSAIRARTEQTTGFGSLTTTGSPERL